MASVINQINIDNTNYAIAASAYAECSTAAATVAKVASIITDGDTTNVDFTLIKGVSVKVKFTYSNTASNPTLNINGTGAKSIKRYGTTAVGTSASTSWRAGAVVELTYDGTNWVMTTSIDDNSGDITNVSAGVGIAGGGSSGSVTVKAKLRSETALTVDSAAATTTSGRVYPVAVDKTGYLAVNVPWVNSTNFASTTHKHAYSGTTAASASEVAVVTEVGADGTATALTGVKVSNSSPAAPGGHTHAYNQTTGVTLTANASNATGRIAYVSSVDYTPASASGTNKAGSEGHTHTYDKASLSGSNTSHTTKYMKFSAGTTPVSSASPSHTSTASGTNSGTGITVVTGVSGGSGSLTSNDTSTGGIAYIASHSAASLGTASTSSAAPGGHTHSYTKATGVTLHVAGSENNTDGEIRVLGDYEAVSVGSSGHTHTVTVSGTTAGSSSSYRTTVVTGSLSGTTLTLSTTTVPSNSHVHSYGSSTALTTGSPSATTLVVKSCSPIFITPSLDTTSANTGANSGTNFNAVTGYPSFSGGSGTTKYLHHTHTGASASGTNTAAPNSHTHAYDKTTSITLSRGNAPSMNFNTQSSSDTPYVASMTNSSIGISHTSTNTGAPSATTSFVTGVSGGTLEPSTKYLSATPSNTSTSTTANSGTNFNAATEVAATGTASVLKGVKATGTVSVTTGNHTHTYSGTTGTPQ